MTIESGCIGVQHTVWMNTMAFFHISCNWSNSFKEAVNTYTGGKKGIQNLVCRFQKYSLVILKNCFKD